MGVTAVSAGIGIGFALPIRCYGKTKRKRTSLGLAFHCHASASSSSSSSRDWSDNKTTSSSSAGKGDIISIHNCSENYTEIPNYDISVEWNWERWQEHFSEVERQESQSSVLKFQLEAALESEDFQDASRLKRAIAAVTAKDTVAEVMSELKKAIEEERYLDAARLRDDAGVGLVGWWYGLPQASNDSYGRIIQISPAQGRFVAKRYSARQLAAARPGVPLFEIFVTNDGDLGYKQQAVYLQRARGTSGESLPASTAVDANLLGSKSSPEGNQNDQGAEISVDVEKDGDKSDDTDHMDDGLNRALNFLSDRLPGMKFKILKVIAPEGLEMDSKMFEQLIQEDEEEKDERNIGKRSQDEIKIEGDPEDDKTTLGNGDFTEKHKEIPIKIVITGDLQGSSEDKVPIIVARVPARIEYRGRDSFVFHHGEQDIQDQAAGKDESDLKVETIVAQESSDLELSDAEKDFPKLNKGRSKGRRVIEEMLKLLQVNKRSGLPGSTMFQRINVEEANSDPLSGLYIGAFGRQSSEVVQLRRRYGHWHDANESASEDSKLEFFEYVEAITLSGDLYSPAGQVTFRAKTGKENRLSNRGAYPEALGVIARYKGQGRLAVGRSRESSSTFVKVKKESQWIDGELVLLGGKGGSLTEGAELGFIYCVAEKHILVSFNRLKLEE